MKLAILCLCLATAASAAPSPFHYMPHYAASRQQVPSSQVKTPFTAAQPGGYSVEYIYPHTFPGGAGGANAGQPYSTFGIMKVSIPQPPGRQSVEVYYPYDFAQQKIIKSIPPMTNAPHVLNTVFPFEYPFPHFPQQTLNNPAFDASPLPSQDPMQPLQQDEPKQPNQMPTKM
uniref:Uncharacterized protein n=1 Tax=Monopterus albus TaxID=43700 RepID=A0A3Q3IP34_MONAL